MRSKILIILSLHLFFGCATMVNEGKLKTINVFENMPKAKKSVTIRLYDYTTHFMDDKKLDWYNVETSNYLTNEAQNIFANSSAFKQVEVASFSSNTISASEANKDFTFDLFEKPIKKSKTDYFIDIVIQEEDRFPSKNVKLILVLPMALTLGFLPVYTTEKTVMDFKIYNSKSELIRTFTVKDEMIAWHWTPLILFPASKSLPSKFELAQKNLVKSIQNLLDQSFKSGVFND